MQDSTLLFTTNYEKAVAEVRKYGGRIAHIFSDQAFVVTLPQKWVAQLKLSTTTQPAKLPEDVKIMVEGWKLFEGRMAAQKTRKTAAPRQVLSWDTPGKIPPGPQMVKLKPLPQQGASAADKGPEMSTGTPTSLTMTSTIAVGIVVVSGKPWTRISGALKSVDVGNDGTVWGANSSDKIFRYNGNNTWTQIPGALKQVSVGNSTNVWGVNSNDDIFRYNNGSNSWTQIPGKLKHVSVGKDGTVWGVNSSDQIFRYNAAANNWTQISGALKQISVADATTVWGVNASNKIFKFNAAGNNWTQIGGNLKYVSAAYDGTVFGVNNSDEIYQYQYDSEWHRLSGALKVIAARSATQLWGVNSTDQIYQVEGGSPQEITNSECSTILSEVLEGLNFLANAEPAAKVTFSHKLNFVTVGAAPGVGAPTYEGYEAPWRNAALALLGFAATRQGSRDYVRNLITTLNTKWGYVGYFTKYPLAHFAYAGEERLVMDYRNDGWGVDKINQVFAHESCHIFGAADEYGTCGCGVSGIYNIPNSNCVNCATPAIPHVSCLMDGNILSLCRFSRGQIGWSTWNQVSGKLKYVSAASDGTVWGVNSRDNIFRFNAAAGNWTQIPGALKQVSAGSASLVWGVNANDEIYRYNPGTNNWTQIPGSLKHVSVAADGTVWGVNSTDKIYRYNSASNNWTQIPGALKQVCAGSSSIIWGVNSSNLIFKYNPGSNNWTQIPGALKHVSAAADGTVYGVNSSDEIYFYNGNSTWTRVSGALKEISAGSASRVWGVNANDDIFQRQILATP